MDMHGYGGLNRHCPHRLTCFNAYPIGSDNIRRCCCRKYVTVVGGLEVSHAQASPIVAVIFLLPADVVVELCLYATMLPTVTIMG